MRALLLAGVGVVALSGSAFASGKPIVDHFASALGVNTGSVSGNASTTMNNNRGVAMTGSFRDRRGVSNANQNAGANSLQQNTVAVAYIEGCGCEVSFKSPEFSAQPYSLADAANGVTVQRNTSANAGGRADANMTDSFGGGQGIAQANQNAGANSAQQNTTTVAAIEGAGTGWFGSAPVSAATAGNSGTVQYNGSTNLGSSAGASTVGSFNSGSGIAQANQNAGANSGQQNATAVASITGVGGQFPNRNAYATAGNTGAVQGSGNSSYDFNHSANGSIGGSFNSRDGITNSNQNVGANSLQQNSVAIAGIEYCNCVANDLSTTVAAAANVGHVVGNHATAIGGSAGVSMTNSFNGGNGITNVSQNAGANSLMQNSVAVGAVYGRAR